MENDMAMQDNQKPPMPNMAGANMSGGKPSPQEIAAKAKQNMMRPSEEIAAVLVARLGALTPQQLAELDRAITPEVANAIVKIIPELGALIKMVDQGEAPAAPQQAQGQPMGALGGMA